MTGRFLVGLVLLVVAFGPVVRAVSLWRPRLLPNMDVPQARLVEITVVLSIILVGSELLGLVGLFRLVAVAPVFAVLGAFGWSTARARSTDSLEAGLSRRRRSSSWQRTTGLIACGVVIADWLPRVADAYAHGMTSVDTLWYHMPFAARFVQEHSLSHLHYVDSQAVTVFFPDNSEVFHALGIMFMGSDVLSPLVNIGWLVVALLAAWCFGQRFGAPWVSVAGAAALFSTPGLVATQPGGAYDDTAALAMLLASLALYVDARHRAEASGHLPVLVAGLAAGFSLGTIFTLIAPIAAFTVGVFWLERVWSHRRTAGTWLLGLVATASFWYVRNLVDVGNPIPNLRVRLGPISLPQAVSPTTHPSSVSRFLFHGTDWSRYFFPGLHLSFGPAWWALLGCALAGVVFGVLIGHPVIRVLGLVAAVSFVGFLVTPQYLAVFGVPVFFVENVRYADPAILLGLVLLPVHHLVARPRVNATILVVYVAVVAADQLDPTLWPVHIFSSSFVPSPSVDSALAGLVVATGAVVAAVALTRLGRRARFAPVAVAVAIVAVGGIVLNDSYLNNRYTTGPIFGPGGSSRIVATIQNLQHTSLGIAGSYAQLQYPLYGRALDNRVQYVGDPQPSRGYAPITSCRTWVQQVNDGGFRYLYLGAGPADSSKAVAHTRYSYTTWTELDPSTRLVRREVTRLSTQGSTQFFEFSLFKLDGPLHLATCDTSQARSVVTPGVLT